MSDNVSAMAELERLDPDGDVVVVVEDQSPLKRRFLVSSKVLSVASPVFAKLFSFSPREPK